MDSGSKQHQGEPVARVEVGADRNACVTITDNNWLRGLKDKTTHQVVPLYTHADPGEVGRYGGELQKLRVDAAALAGTVEGLRALLAERDALLRYVDDQLTNMQPHIEQACYPGRAGFIDNYVDPVIERIRALSASAEPSAF